MLMTPTLLELLEKNPEYTGFRQHFLPLYSIIYGMEPESVLEVGAGYSTYMILGALADLNKGGLISIDKRSKEQTMKDVHPRLEGRLTYIQSDFKAQDDFIATKTYDVFLHDGSHTASEVASDIGLVASRMRQNGLILVHDTLGLMRSGPVLSRLDCEYEYVTLPYGYGLTIIRILTDFGHGRIAPKWRKL